VFEAADWVKWAALPKCSNTRTALTRSTRHKYAAEIVALYEKVDTPEKIKSDDTPREC
jgi:hypothetical protein